MQYKIERKIKKTPPTHMHVVQLSTLTDVIVGEASARRVALAKSMPMQI